MNGDPLPLEAGARLALAASTVRTETAERRAELQAPFKPPFKRLRRARRPMQASVWWPEWFANTDEPELE